MCHGFDFDWAKPTKNENTKDLVNKPIREFSVSIRALKFVPSNRAIQYPGYPRKTYDKFKAPKAR